MAEPTASIWDVVRLMMTEPGTDPSETAREHGFDIAEVAELLPLLADNLRVDFARSGLPDTHLPPAQPAPGESPAHFVGRYLASVGGSEGAQVGPYVTLGGPVDGGGPPTAVRPEVPDSFGAGYEDASTTGPDPSVPASDGDPPPLGHPATDEPAVDGPATDEPAMGGPATGGPFDGAARPDYPDTTVSDIEPPDLSDRDFQFD